MLKVAICSEAGSKFASLNCLALCSCYSIKFNTLVSVRNNFFGQNMIEDFCTSFKALNRFTYSSAAYSDFSSPDYCKHILSYQERFKSLFNNKSYTELGSPKLRLYQPPTPYSKSQFDEMPENGLSFLNLSSHSVMLSENAISESDVIIINIPDFASAEVFIQTLRLFYYPFRSQKKYFLFLLGNYSNYRSELLHVINVEGLDPELFTIIPYSKDLQHTSLLGTSDEFFSELFHCDDSKLLDHIYFSVCRKIKDIHTLKLISN